MVTYRSGRATRDTGCGAGDARRWSGAGSLSRGHLVMIVAGVVGIVLSLRRAAASPRATRSWSPRTRSAPAKSVTATDFRTEARHDERRDSRHVRARATGPASRDASRPPRSPPVSSSFAVRCGRVLPARSAGDEHSDRSLACRRRSPGRRRPHRRAVRRRSRGVDHRRATPTVIAVDAKGRRRHRRDRQPLHGHDRGDGSPVTAARGGDRRRRHLARAHDGRAVVAGHRAAAARPGRRAATTDHDRLTTSDGIANPPSRSSSRRNSGSKTSIATSPTTAARACVRSCSSPRSRSRTSTTRWS